MIKPYCKTCTHYTTEYQGKYTEFTNYCREKKCRVCLLDCGCRSWERASAEQMEQREKVWNDWIKIEVMQK